MAIERSGSALNTARMMETIAKEQSEESMCGKLLRGDFHNGGILAEGRPGHSCIKGGRVSLNGFRTLVTIGLRSQAGGHSSGLVKRKVRGVCLRLTKERVL